MHRITIADTGCDGLTRSIYWTGNDNQAQISMAYAANTIANLPLPHPGPESAGLRKLQTWSRNEPGWLDGTFLSIDGAALENLAWTEYTLDGQPHSFEFVCNFTTQRPVGAMTQVVYSAQATTSTTTVTAEPTVEPFNPHEVFYRSNCRSGPMLVNAPNNPDFMVIHNEDFDHMGYVPMETTNYSISITPLNGRQLCTRHEFDQYEHCDWIGVEQTMPPREYELTFFCANEQSISPPHAPFGSSTVNLQIGAKCPYVIAQVDCERNGQCTVKKFPSTTPTVSFKYALRELLHVKAVGSGWQKAYWSITYAVPGYEPISYVQNRGKLLDITPLPFAGDMQVKVECIEDNMIGVSCRTTATVWWC